jgi:hypothetical protein
LAAVAGAGAFAASGAWAQDAAAQAGGDNPSNFARNRNVSVRERQRPGYEAHGSQLGGFDLLPRLTSSAEFNDNVYATQNNKISDVVVHVTPEVALRSHWSRHSLAAFGRVNLNRYLDHSGEDTTDYSGGISGRLDMLRASSLGAAGTFSRLTEPRTSPDAPAAAKAPIVYYLSTVGLNGVHEMTRIKLSGAVNLNHYDYRNGQTLSGQPLLQDQRDRDEWSESGRVEFAESPAVSMYVAGALNQRDYRLGPSATGFARNSTGFSVSTGTSFDITRLIRGDVQVGYMRQSYADPRFKPESGLTFGGAVDWFPSPLITVNLSGSRSIQEAAIANASGYVSTNLALRVDHELLRNVLLRAQGSWGHDNYRGVDRTDNRAAAGLKATYLMNSIVGFSLAYDFQKLSSSGVAKTVSYDDNRVTASLTLQY